jgi:hypothetical protein
VAPEITEALALTLPQLERRCAWGRLNFGYFPPMQIEQ